MAPVDVTIKHYLALYDEALPEVYGYVIRRVDSAVVAEDVTAETFLSAMDTITRGMVVTPTVAWLIGVARHKVADHWRRQAREQRRVEAVAAETAGGDRHHGTGPGTDRWDEVLDAQLAHATLAALSPNHRAALSLRYLDGLPVGEIAHLLGRTIGATEALLTRAKAAFRTAYPAPDQPTNRNEPKGEAGD